MAPNSIDAVSNRDFVLDYLAAASICAMHLSRLGAEIVLWSSDEFSFCELAEDFSSGSSIMPQKKNPDAAELLRAKAPRIASGFLTLAGVMHGLAARLLEGPPGGQGGAVRRRRQPRAVPRGGGADARGPELRSRAARARRPPTSSRRRPTSPTSWSARGCRSARRTAWSAGLVREALEQGKALSELTPEELGRHSDLLDDSYYEALRVGAAGWSRRRSVGGTASARLAEQLEAARTALDEIRR